jgi:hypothetical protein
VGIFSGKKSGSASVKNIPEDDASGENNTTSSVEKKGSSLKKLSIKSTPRNSRSKGDSEYSGGASITPEEIDQDDTKYVPYVSGPDVTGSWVSWSPFWRGVDKCFVKFTFKVQNIGDEIAETTLIKFYLSKDNYFDPEDTFIKEATVGNLVGGADYDISLEDSVHQIEAVDRLIAVIDPAESLSETDEENNIVPSTIFID